MSDHNDGRRYWLCLPCGDCDDPNCLEGDMADATEEVAQLRTDLEVADETVRSLVGERDSLRARIEAREY